MIALKNVPEKCPNCSSKVTFFHSAQGTRVVCKDKCLGFKVIASCKRWDNEYEDGDVL